MTVALVLAEHDRGILAAATLEALTAVREGVVHDGADELHVLVCGEVDDLGAVGVHGVDGVTTIHIAEHALLSDYGPEAWGQVLAELIGELDPDLVVACGTSKGNEVMAQAAARLDLPFVANCIAFDDVDGDFDGSDDMVEITRVQWGGSLLERAALEAETVLVSIAHHSIEASPSASPGEPLVEQFEPDLDDGLARTVVVGREIAEAGVTLATAPVVVGGGRAVGGPDAFAPLEELAELLGGRVGCSRAVTNNGWRPHSDQVGQTGTRIAPELYIASGISGAIQHWVGAMAAKQILAINTDPEANMVTKADYAVIGDLHEVIPAVVDEVRRRKG